MNGRKLFVTLFVCCFSVMRVCAQENLIKELQSQDLSLVFNAEKIKDDSGTEIIRPEILGFIGDNYQRLQIHFTKFTKSTINHLQYNVEGKTKVKNNICNFKGTVTITEANYNAEPVIPTLEGYKTGTVISKVEIYEDSNQNSSGIIKGELITDIVFSEDGKAEYDALMLISDGFANNQFKGIWTSYKTGKSKQCNWGDFRIPDSGSLDVGAGEFSVDSPYRENGWQSFYDSYCCDSNIPKTKAARKKEFEKWWL